MDSGASANTIRARLVKNYKKKDLKFPLTWETTNGSFDTTETVEAKFQMPEFSDSTTVTQTFHVCEQKMPYDVILGRNALQQLGITLDFKDSVIKWNDTSVEMKEPTFLNKKSNLANLAYDDDPLHCAESSERAERILEITSPKQDLAAIVENQKI